ncbi:hypothetical protein [Micromonospora sp. B9E7]|uniref:hypothetical protein n=1 Tax=Micromonospora sp. B9E7 TaxID=3153574 RepID=UPI00325C996A
MDLLRPEPRNEELAAVLPVLDRSPFVSVKLKTLVDVDSEGDEGRERLGGR